MSLSVICRHNQARSIIAAAALRKFFPDQEVTSFGTEANRGQPIPESVTRLATAWSLSAYDRISLPVDVQWLKSTQAAILAADETVAAALAQENQYATITTLSNLADDVRLAPTDPAGFAPDDLACELAKVIVLSIRWGNSLAQLEPNIESVLVLNEDQEHGATQLNEIPKDSILIDVDFSLPETKKWYQGRTPTTFNPRRLADFEIERFDQPNLVIHTGFEIDTPERIYTSTNWRDFLMELSKIRPITLISSFPQQGAKVSALSVLSLSHSARSRIW